MCINTSSKIYTVYRIVFFKFYFKIYFKYFENTITAEDQNSIYVLNLRIFWFAKGTWKVPVQLNASLNVNLFMHKLFII